jgi:hypothetical protein
VGEAIANSAGHCVVVAVAHFNPCLQQLPAAVAGLDQKRVFVISSDLLKCQTPSDFAADPSNSILIIVGERHPLPAQDEVIFEFARRQPERCLVVYHVSLEDPLLKRFAGQRVERVLRGLV